MKPDTAIIIEPKRLATALTKASFMTKKVNLYFKNAIRLTVAGKSTQYLNQTFKNIFLR